MNQHEKELARSAEVENRYDGEIPPAIRDRLRQHPDPKVRRRAELESIVKRSAAEVKRATQAQIKAREQRHMIHVRFLEIERSYHQARLSLAEALLEREQFDD